jgi:pimeloyl-ACP methyl ester carboxylesterase
VLVLIHGISRNAEEIIHNFFDKAQKNNILIIAPVFTKEYATDYQRLGRNGRGPRADYQLFAILNDCQSKTGHVFNKFNIFGFSAGAQYAHRLAFAHPNKINKVALVAAGWYTLPTTSLPYPRGLRLKNQFSDLNFYANQFLRLNYRVYIGSKDNKRDHALNKNPKIDLTQGRNRIKRAKNWIEFMQLQMDKLNIKNEIKLEILPQVRHDFLECVQQASLVERVIKWMLKNA